MVYYRESLRCIIMIEVVFGLFGPALPVVNTKHLFRDLNDLEESFLIKEAISVTANSVGC